MKDPIEAAHAAAEIILTDPELAQYRNDFLEAFPGPEELATFLLQRQKLWQGRRGYHLINNGEVFKVHLLVQGILSSRSKPA